MLWAFALLQIDNEVAILQKRIWKYSQADSWESIRIRVDQEGENWNWTLRSSVHENRLRSVDITKPNSKVFTNRQLGINSNSSWSRRKNWNWILRCSVHANWLRSGDTLQKCEFESIHKQTVGIKFGFELIKKEKTEHWILQFYPHANWATQKECIEPKNKRDTKLVSKNKGWRSYKQVEMKNNPHHSVTKTEIAWRPKFEQRLRTFCTEDRQHPKISLTNPHKLNPRKSVSPLERDREKNRAFRTCFRASRLGTKPQGQVPSLLGWSISKRTRQNCKKNLLILMESKLMSIICLAGPCETAWFILKVTLKCLS